MSSIKDKLESKNGRASVRRILTVEKLANKSKMSHDLVLVIQGSKHVLPFSSSTGFGLGESGRASILVRLAEKAL